MFDRGVADAAQAGRPTVMLDVANRLPLSVHSLV
jgi:hypothetical protein